MQNYITEAENEYVIRGNSAVVKCKIPSFVADFVSVDAWLDDSDTTYTLFNTNNNNYYYRKSSRTAVMNVILSVCVSKRVT